MRAQRVPSGLLLGLASVSAVSALHEQGARHHHVARSASATLSAPPMNTAVVNGVTRGIKAGLSGYLGVQSQAAFQQIAPHISWYSDYQANTTDVGDVAGVGMLWGDNTACGGIGQGRLAAFDQDVVPHPPKIMFGFYEPDCKCSNSSSMTVSNGIDSWNSLIAPLAAKGTLLGSPSACDQFDETWLQEFSGISSANNPTWGSNDGKTLGKVWDVTSIHINKNSIEGVREDVDYYVRTYGRPVWVSEFACVDDQNGFTPCTDQGTIDQFISDAVNFFHCNETVVAYGPSSGAGLGDVWPLIAKDGSLSPSGQSYVKALTSFTSAPNQCSS